MKKCSRCGTRWSGYGPQPRPRDLCAQCGGYLHSCVNCHHFDRKQSYSCKLTHTSFVGNRESLNYCEDFRMLDLAQRASEDRVVRARNTWEELFRR